jgi:hypothetical protein
MAPGGLRPSAFAVFKLMTRWNWVGAWAGKSPALVPLEDAIHVVGRSPEKTGRNGFKTPTAKGGMGLRQIGGELAANNRR